MVKLNRGQRIFDFVFATLWLVLGLVIVYVTIIKEPTLVFCLPLPVLIAYGFYKSAISGIYNIIGY
jgi:hypothetical protein